MRYEIEIVESIGPLMTAALGDIDVLDISCETRLTIVGFERLSPQSLLRLYELGLDIEGIRCRDVDPTTRRS